MRRLNGASFRQPLLTILLCESDAVAISRHRALMSSFDTQSPEIEIFPKMAVADPPPLCQISEEIVDTTEGHYTRYKISVFNLGVLRTRPVTKIYRTFCKVVPTVWTFKISFPEVRRDGSSLSIRLVRTDSLDGLMVASVWVDVRDLDKDEVFPREHFTCHQMETGDSLEVTLPLTPNPGMASAINENLIVLVTIIVSDCHPFKWGDGSPLII